MVFGKSNSLQYRVSQLAVSTTVIAVVVLTLASGLISHSLETKKSASDLVEVADLVTRATVDATESIVSDARILANMPPVPALIRASANNGIDPVSGDGTLEWKDRLATIFSSFHAMRPNYTQIRFVGFADGGREIVRVNKDGASLVRVPEEQLQLKGEEPYLQEAAELGYGGVHIGKPSFNRENGVIQEPRKLVYRTLVPVFDEDGTAFGFIAINVDLIEHNAATFEPLELSSDFILSYSSGSTYSWRADRQRGDFAFDAPSSLPTAVANQVQRAGSGLTRITKDGIDYLSTQLDRLSRNTHQVHVTLIKPRHFFGQTLPISTLQLFALGLLLIVAAARYTRAGLKKALAPMIDMSRDIVSAANDGRDPVLPVLLPDEVGDLARSFRHLLDRLRQQEAHAGKVYDAVLDGLAVIDANGTILNCNRSFQTEFEVPPSDVSDVTLSDFVTPEDWRELQTEITTFLSTGSPQAFGRVNLCTGHDRFGNEVTLEVSISPLPDQHPPLFVAVVRDVTARIALEDEAKSLIARLNRSNSELEEFAYVASHDLKAPLRVISHAATWLEEDLEGLLTEDTREHMHFMKSRIQRMARLLDDLLLHSRIGSIEFDPSREIVDGTAMVEDLEKLVESSEQIALRFSDEFKSARLNFLPLRTVLLNLIGNSIKHSDKEQGEIFVSLQDCADHYSIRVKDNGPGIPEKFHGLIFGLFKTLQSRDKVEGSGMGLAFVKKHLTILGHDIQVISDGSGQGTEFVFTWPKPIEAADQNAA
ncbi:MAG: hypothetical protein BM562_06115 [Alphaproteobacteria bacterium MedPE-SWcel]|nr:MAG: hypothetical protein BM562_06115 [Alphaproteobacteria bacterium MedPE-SWcel]